MVPITTQQEWLACTDPLRLLDAYMACRRSDRKLRLAAVACARSRDREDRPAAVLLACDMVELYADGKITSADLRAADEATMTTRIRLGAGVAMDDSMVALLTVLGYGPIDRTDYRPDSQWGAGDPDRMRDVFASPFVPLPYPCGSRIPRRASPCGLWLHCGVCRAMYAWNDGTVPRMAQRIYDDHTFSDLPILADALEEAGCTEASLLDHLRGPGPHVRGCWALDLLLGKE